MTTPNDADRAAAHALCDEHDLCDWPSENYHSAPCVAIAQAIANARTAENVACEQIASEVADMHEQACGYYDAASQASDAIADRIAARRTP